MKGTLLVEENNFTAIFQFNWRDFIKVHT